MRRYNYSEMGAIWCDHAREIVKHGVFIANDGSNWDLWEHNGTVYSIPVEGSGCSASVWCGVKNLRQHLYGLMHICGRSSLIPSCWENVNTDFLESLGIC